MGGVTGSGQWRRCVLASSLVLFLFNGCGGSGGAGTTTDSDGGAYDDFGLETIAVTLATKAADYAFKAIAGYAADKVLNWIYGDPEPEVDPTLEALEQVQEDLKGISEQLDNVAEQLAGIESKVDTLLAAINETENNILYAIQEQSLTDQIDTIRSLYERFAHLADDAATGAPTEMPSAEAKKLADDILDKYDLPMVLDRIHYCVSDPGKALVALTNKLVAKHTGPSHADILSCYETLEYYFGEWLGYQAQGLLLLMNAYELESGAARYTKESYPPHFWGHIAAQLPVFAVCVDRLVTAQADPNRLDAGFVSLPEDVQEIYFRADWLLATVSSHLPSYVDARRWAYGLYVHVLQEPGHVAYAQNQGQASPYAELDWGYSGTPPSNTSGWEGLLGGGNAGREYPVAAYYGHVAQASGDGYRYRLERYDSMVIHTTFMAEDRVSFLASGPDYARFIEAKPRVPQSVAHRENFTFKRYNADRIAVSNGGPDVHYFGSLVIDCRELVVPVRTGRFDRGGGHYPEPGWFVSFDESPYPWVVSQYVLQSGAATVSGDGALAGDTMFQTRMDGNSPPWSSNLKAWIGTNTVASKDKVAFPSATSSTSVIQHFSGKLQATGVSDPKGVKVLYELARNPSDPDDDATGLTSFAAVGNPVNIVGAQWQDNIVTVQPGATDWSPELQLAVQLTRNPGPNYHSFSITALMKDLHFVPAQP